MRNGSNRTRQSTYESTTPTTLRKHHIGSDGSGPSAAPSDPATTAEPRAKRTARRGLSASSAYGISTSAGSGRRAMTRGANQARQAAATAIAAATSRSSVVTVRQDSHSSNRIARVECFLWIVLPSDLPDSFPVLAVVATHPVAGFEVVHVSADRSLLHGPMPTPDPATPVDDGPSGRLGQGHVPLQRRQRVSPRVRRRCRLTRSRTSVERVEDDRRTTAVP